MYLSANAEESRRQMELTGKGKHQGKCHQNELRKQKPSTTVDLELVDLELEKARRTS